MVDTYVQKGDVVNYVCTEAVTAGMAYIIGTMVGVAQNTGIIGDTVPFFITGVHNLLLKTGGATPAFGDVVSFDVTTKNVALGAGLVGDVNNAGKVMSNDALETDTYIEILLTPATGIIAT